MKKINDFTQGRILLPLIRFAFPVLIALFLQAMYGAVDLLIVGKFATTADISGVATGSQVMHTVTTVLTGLAMGITVLLGQKIGEGNAKMAGKVIGAGIFLFLLITLGLTAVLVICAEPLCSVMHAPEEAFSATVQYVRICAAGTVFIIAFNVIGSIFRGIGDANMPLFTVAVACVVNIGGDLLLIKGFHMGADGAALATVFAQAVSVVISLWIAKRRTLPFSFTLKDIRFDRGMIGSILRIGAPMAAQDLLVSISFLVITAIVNTLGLIQSAGVGVAQKLCGFVLLIPSSYMQSMSAFVAQNVGAQRPDRAKKALFYGICTALGTSVVIAYFAFFHGDILAGIFANEADVIAAAASYLKAYAIDTLLTSFLFCFIGYYSGNGKTLFVMLQGIIGAFCVRVPVSYFVSRIPNVSLFYIGLATPSSTALQILLCFGYWFLLKRQSRVELRKQ